MGTGNSPEEFLKIIQNMTEIDKSEGAVQTEFFKWAWNSYPHLRGLFFHIPNGGARRKIEANKLKALGVVAGVHDIFVSIPASGFAGLYMEFKEPGKDTLDPKQREFKEMAMMAGYRCILVNDVTVAKLSFKKYIDSVDTDLMNKFLIRYNEKRGI